MDWILYQIDFFQKLKFLILSSLSAGFGFPTDALSWLSDWIPGRKRHPDWLLAPSSKHQFENLPGPLLEHLHPKTRSTSLFQPFWNWFYLFSVRFYILVTSRECHQHTCFVTNKMVANVKFTDFSPWKNIFKKVP